MPSRRLLLAAIALVPYAVLLLPAWILAVSMALFASCVRTIGRLLEPRFVPWTDLIAFDSVLGWRPRAGLDTHYLADRDDVYHVTTDSEGWPGRRSVDDSDIVVIGDSFAFGYGVDANRTFAELHPRLRMKAVGAPGYSMVHGVLLMEQFGSRLSGKLVVWLVFLENDLQDNLLPEMRQYRAPFVRSNGAGAGWEIVGDHIRRESWACSDADKRRLFPQLCTPGPIADRAYSACEYLIHRAAATCSRSGARLVVFTVPDLAQLTPQGMARVAALSGNPGSCDPDLPDRRISDCCRAAGIAMLSGKSHLSPAHYNVREGIHWSRKGHRRVAALLADCYHTYRAAGLHRLALDGSLLRLSRASNREGPFALDRHGAP